MQTIVPDSVKKIMAETGLSYLEARKRLKGMQGPERHLVGESRSDRKRGGVKEAKPRRRAVGEIVERNELLRRIARKIDQARRCWQVAERAKAAEWVEFYRGQVSVLTELQEEVSDIAEERSDLSNARAVTPATETDHGK